MKNKHHTNFIIMINGRKKLSVKIRCGLTETRVDLCEYNI